MVALYINKEEKFPRYTLCDHRFYDCFTTKDDDSCRICNIERNK